MEAASQGAQHLRARAALAQRTGATQSRSPTPSPIRASPSAINPPSLQLSTFHPHPNPHPLTDYVSRQTSLALAALAAPLPTARASASASPVAPAESSPRRSTLLCRRAGASHSRSPTSISSTRSLVRALSAAAWARRSASAPRQRRARRRVARALPPWPPRPRLDTGARYRARSHSRSPNTHPSQASPSHRPPIPFGSRVPITISRTHAEPLIHHAGTNRQDSRGVGRRDEALTTGCVRSINVARMLQECSVHAAS